MEWFNKGKLVKSDKDLQDELQALCDKIIGQQMGWSEDWSRYESLLREIYRRNLTPITRLQPTSLTKK